MRMQRMKFMVSILLVVLLPVLSSCIGDDDGKREEISILKVKQDSYLDAIEFVDAAGLVLKPTTTLSGAPESDLAYLHYNYSINEFNAGTKVLNINVLDKPFYIPGLSVEPLNNNVVAEKHFIFHNVLGEESGIWGKEYLILNYEYFLHDKTTEETLSDELKKHEVALYYNPDEIIQNDVLKLYLKYEMSTNVEDDLISTEYNKPFSVVKYFDLSEALYHFKSQNDREPSKVMIEYIKDSKAGVVTQDSHAYHMELNFE